MKIVVYPHVLELGGSQLNAVELAAAVRDLGHDVVVFGQPGALVDRVRELGVEFVASPDPGRRPSWSVMAALVELVRHRGIDVVHGYEWTAGLEAFAGPHLRLGTPAVCTVMSMAVAPFLPADMPLVVGTEQIAADERSRGRRNVTVIEPPVDIVHNAPGTVDAHAFRTGLGIEPHELMIVAVTRLVAELKLEGLLTAVEVVADLAGEHPLRLVVVGGGPAADHVRARAFAANARAGRDVVLLTGELSDPRPAYAAADISIGMGGSALRAMAFGAPLVVQGERGFWRTLTPDTLETFLWTGWYGVGDDPAAGEECLRAQLRPLLSGEGRRRELGAFALQVVDARFALHRAARRQEQVYEDALSESSRRVRTRPLMVSAGRFAGYKLDRQWQRLRGRARADDFNARPVAARSTGGGRPDPSGGAARPLGPPTG